MTKQTMTFRPSKGDETQMKIETIARHKEWSYSKVIKKAINVYYDMILKEYENKEMK